MQHKIKLGYIFHIQIYGHLSTIIESYELLNALTHIKVYTKAGLKYYIITVTYILVKKYYFDQHFFGRVNVIWNM